jgi:hypothetical protein
VWSAEPASRGRWLTNEHGERRERPERPESDQLEFHHAGHAQRKFFRDCVRLLGAGRVHDEDDAIAIGLKEPLLDLGEMITNRRADFVRQDRRDGVESRLKNPRGRRRLTSPGPLNEKFKEADLPKIVLRKQTTPKQGRR